jgi:uncharacterized protein YcsI (UPF0317 family)
MHGARTCGCIGLTSAECADRSHHFAVQKLERAGTNRTGLMRSASIGMLAVPSVPRFLELLMGVTARELEADRSLTNGLAARLACRRGALRGTTAGVAPGYVQGNLAVLPKDLAADFLRFCQANPKPCPLIGVSDPGNPKIPSLGLDLDIRSNLPGYRVWRNGELVEETGDVSAHWRDDLVAFVIGCSYSFEEALIEDGIQLRHVERRLRVPMYRTSIACTPTGPFAGPMVVSMRPLKPAHAIRAIQITSRFPSVHGAPVHVGLPDRHQRSRETRLWRPGRRAPGRAAGVLGVWRHAAITVKPPFAITHAPGAMLVTDLKNRQFAVI